SGRDSHAVKGPAEPAREQAGATHCRHGRYGYGYASGSKSVSEGLQCGRVSPRPESCGPGSPFLLQVSSPFRVSERPAYTHVSGSTWPSLTGNGRPSMSRSSARGEIPSAWKIVAWMSGGPQGRVRGNAP